MFSCVRYTCLQERMRFKTRTAKKQSMSHRSKRAMDGAPGRRRRFMEQPFSIKSFNERVPLSSRDSWPMP